MLFIKLICRQYLREENEEEVKQKFAAMVKKLAPDVVMCGLALHYPNFGEMAGGLASVIETIADMPAFAAMAIENQQLKNIKTKYM